MSRSSAPQVLERPGTGDDLPASDPSRARPARRRLPHPPGRRAPLWFAALVAGAVLAGVPALTGGPGQVAVSASEYGLGVSADSDFAGYMDAGVRRGITEAEAQARLTELAASRAAREPKTVVPAAGRLSSTFGSRWGSKHYGIDLAAPLGTPIVAAADGVVLEAGRASGYGNAIYIEDTEGFVHVYGHMRYWNVEVGQVVRAGDEIAKVGNEGFSTGPHLHYEIHQGGRDGAPTDPEAWLESYDVAVG